MAEKIAKSNVQEIIELNKVQKGMLYHYLKDKDEDVYNVQLSFSIEGDLKIDLLKEAFSRVQSGNEALRSVFRWAEVKTPVQIILKEYPLDFSYQDLSGPDSNEAFQAVAESSKADQHKRFDLNHLPVKISLIKTGERSYVMNITNHHVLYDGWSNGVFLKELFRTYHALNKGEPINTEVKASYTEVQASLLKKTQSEESMQFWTDYLQGHEATYLLPVEKGKGGQEVKKQSYQTAIDGIEAFSKKHQVTPASVIYAAYGLLLQQYTNNSDIMFGTVVSNRDAAIRGIEHVIGNYINTLPLRFSNGKEKTLTEIVTDVNQSLIDRSSHNNISLPDIKDALNIKAETLFDSIIAVENYPLNQKEIELNNDLAIKLRAVYENTSFPLLINVFFKEELEVQFTYKTALTSDSYVRSLAHNFMDLLEQIVHHGERLVSSLNLTLQQEERELLESVNDTEVPYFQGRTVMDLFEDQVKKHPENVALRLNGNPLTYNELNEKSDRIASFLFEKRSVGPNSLVGVMLERERELIPVIFGILKAGGAYVPIDPDYPVERINAIISDAGLKALVTRSKYLDSVVTAPEGLVNLDETSKEISNQSVNNTIPPAGGNDLAYVIYTSGSTGKPKGVMIEHHAVVNRIQWMQNRYPISEEDVLLQKTPIVFDVSVWELFWWSQAGASLCLLKPGEEKDPKAITAAIKRHRVSTIHFVPSMLNAFLLAHNEGFSQEYLTSLRQVFTSGEALKPKLVHTFGQSIHQHCGTRLINLYGPTEATVDVSYYECSFDEQPTLIPIGKPIDNTQLHVLDERLNVLPIGVAGELHIAGAGLARGYLNREELTGQKFIKSPFSSKERLYKTGDLARWLPDGNIEFLGRIDDQVKVRGFRIEPGEVETHLAAHPQIHEAAVICQNRNEEASLVSYYLSDIPLEAPILRDYMLSKLPAYMVPAHFIRLDTFPLTSNGKINKKEFPEPEFERKSTFVSAKGRIEETLLEIWSDVLGHRNISTDQNFFDVGGDSLKLISVSSRITREFGKEVSVTDLFSYPTIGQLARYVERHQNGHSNQQELTSKAIVKSTKKPLEDSADIAIIGMAGRFPGAQNINEFWENLKSGKESIHRGVDHEAKEGIIKAKGVLKDHEMFEASFFNYTPEEAERMDPQLRVFHECSWEALEDAGYNPFEYSGDIGLYAGASQNPYYTPQPEEDNPDGWLDDWESHIYSTQDYLCTRVSYKLNLTGPSVNIATACSTSLVAIDAACRDLQDGRCDMALSGGITLTFHDDGGYKYKKDLILSPDGYCRAFDKNAAGTVGGNGVGLVVLKKLSDAQRDGDHIYAVIKGTATNNDGIDKVGFTAPGVTGQSKVIKEAIHRANVQPESIGYVETHGTGTLLGDPIELEGLKRAFNSIKEHFCAIGSVKTNIGHLNAAAGVTGLIKTVLSLKNKQIPPSLNFEAPNPALGIEKSPFYVNNQLQDWHRNGLPRRAGVSSFGIGGTNAHVVLEEAPDVRDTSEGRPYQLLVLSAKTRAALDRNMGQLRAFLDSNTSEKLEDIAYTLNNGRAHFDYRKFIVGKDRAEAIEQLTTKSDSHIGGPVRHSLGQMVAFMFPGQGAQYRGMLHDLYENEIDFKTTVDRCFELVNKEFGKDLKGIVFAQAGPQECDLINQTEFTQPLLFIMEYALARLLIKWGIQPGVMIGHSIGEYVAACISGVFSLEDALTLVAKRGELIQSLPGGSMLSVSLSEEELKPLVSKAKGISIAVINGSKSCVVSGNDQAIEEFKTTLEKQSHQCKKVQCSHAFHSHMMDDILKEFEKIVDSVNLNPQQIPFISNLTGEEVRDEDIMKPQYWVRHLRETVRFSEGIATLMANKKVVFVEVGPGAILSSLVRSNELKENTHKVINLARHPRDNKDDNHYLLSALGQLYLNGVSIDWQAFYANEARRKVSLPTYSFEKIRYPVKTRLSENKPIGTQGQLRRSNNTSEWFYLASWKMLPLFPGRENKTKKACTIVFTDDRELTKALVDKLKQDGDQVICVKKGTFFSDEGNDQYNIYPTQDDIRELFRELNGKGITTDRIVYTWPKDNGVEDNDSIESLLTSHSSGFLGLAEVVKAANDYKVCSNTRLTLLTSDLQSVLGQEEINTGKSILPGLLKVVAHEYPSLSVNHIDVVSEEGATDWLVEALQRELVYGEPGKTVAFRNKRRWVQVFEQITSSGSGSVHALREGGVYLITGGLGELGYHLTTHLLKTYQAKVVLTGRSPLPSEDEWPSTLKQDSTADKTRTRIERLQQLTSLGGEVQYEVADTSDPKAMSGVVTNMEEQFGTLNGVIHAAGVVGDEAKHFLKTLTRKEVGPQLLSKVAGVHVLEEVLKDKNLDFRILASSISSVLGGLGFGIYAAANGYMDHFAQKSPDQWLSVNFDGLSLSNEVGQGIDQKEIIEVFHRLLDLKDLPQIVVSVADLNERLNQWVYRKETPEISELHAARHRESDQFSAKENAQSSASAEDSLLVLWQQFFGSQEIDLDDSFFSIGGDSLKALQMIGRIQKEFGIELSLEDLFANSTIRELAQLLNGSLSDVPVEKDTEHTPLAQQLLTLWQNFFGHQEIDVDDIFFAIGGDSLKALQMVARIQKELDIELSIENLFENPSISQLVSWLVASSESTSDIEADIEEIELLGDIPKAPQKPTYPLSTVQRRLHFLNELDKDSLAYNMPFFTSLEGKLDTGKFKSIFNQLAQRHESLRTCFDIIDGVVVQKVEEAIDFDIEYFEADQGEVKPIIDQFMRPFDLGKAPLMRVGLIRRSEDDHILMVDVHHLINDAVSKGILIEDFMALYQGARLKPLPLQYTDFAEWQQGEEFQNRVALQKAFWLNEFSGEILTLQLPTDYPRPSVKNYEGNAIKLVLDAEVTNKLKAVARTEGATLFMALLSIYYVLLHKLSNQEDIVISTPVAGRDLPDLEKIIGMFVNTIALRNSPRGEMRFVEFLSEVRTKTLACFDHQAYPFDELVDELRVERDASRNPLYDVVFAYQNVGNTPLDLPGLKVETIEVGRTTAKFDLELIALESDGQLEFTLEYATQLFKEETAQRFVHYFNRLVLAVIDDSNQKISEISLLTQEEKERLLSNSGRQWSDLPVDKTFVDLFKEQTKSNPDCIALRLNEKKLTYAELDECTDKLAHLLKQQGLKDNAIVGLYVGRSMEMVIGMLSILKAGGAYLPIDIQYPGERIRYMIEDSGITMLLTTRDLKETQTSDLEIICVEDGEDTDQTGSFDCSAQPSDLCYIIYTSGSSGKPKGVMIEHRNLLSYIHWASSFYLKGEALVFALCSSASFDLTVTSIFTPLISGGEIVIYEGDDQASLIEQVFKSNAVDIVKLTPSHLKLLRDTGLLDTDISRLKKLIVGGEDLETDLARDIYDKLGGKVQIFNEYGPTEATVGCMIYEFTPDDDFTSVPIGQAIDHSHIHLLDKHLNLVATGIEGELYISGAGVARGYLSNKPLTEERFLDDPFIPGAKMYKTGDLGTRLTDGRILFEGRRDEQVKLRGYRIELGEIKHQLSGHDQVAESVVIVKSLGDEESQSLVAYYLQVEGEEEPTHLRAYLLDRLPEYMVPAHFVRLERWPLTPHGKLDVKELPDPHIQGGDTQIAPGDETERILLQVWSEVLGVEGIGVTDNFFRIGGDSIKLILIGSKLRKAGFDVSVQDIFGHPTIRQLAGNLKTLTTESDQTLVEGKAGLSPIQYWFLEGPVKDKHHYNQSMILTFPQGITRHETETVFKHLHSHHDALRMTLTQKSGTWQQINKGENHPVSILEKDLRKLKHPSKSILREADKIQASIDLENGPLVKLGLFQMKGDSHLLIVIHHLVVDGISWRILLEDIDSLYQQLKKGEALSLPPKTDSFLSWPAKLEAYTQTKAFQKAKAYWEGLNRNEVLSIERDHPNGEATQKSMGQVSFKLDKAHTSELLTTVHAPFRTQINDILLAALLLAMKKQYGRDVVRIDLEGHGREPIHGDANMGRTVGWFTSIYPLILSSDTDDLSGIIKHVKESLRQVPNNGLDYLLCQQHGDIQADKAAQIAFNYLGQFDTDIEGKSFSLSDEPQGALRSENDILTCDWDISGMVWYGQLEMNIIYSRAQYEESTLRTFVNHYEESLKAIIEYCSGYQGLVLTPSDLTYKSLSIAQLDALHDKHAIEDIYPLSPMQEGMLYHSVLQPDVALYLGQTTCQIVGKLDIKAIEEAMNRIMSRYDILRTSFLYHGYERSLQVVLKDRLLDFTYEDLREALLTEDKATLIVSRQLVERKSVFDLSKDVLMRLVVLQTGEDEYEFIWCYHHILMDGWCMNIIVKEFQKVYAGLIRGEEVALPSVSPYSGYISWLEAREPSLSAAYWEDYLKGYDSLASFPQTATLAGVEGADRMHRCRISINHEHTASLHTLASDCGVTLNTVFQAAWALLLARYNHTDDVVFGAVVSGRPAEVEGIESMVGLFIATIPVRIRLEAAGTMEDLLKSIQARGLESEPHHYHSLSEIQSLSELGDELFDHIVTFENFPDSIPSKGRDGASFEIRNKAFRADTPYEMVVTVVPDDELEVTIDYNSHIYNEEIMSDLLTHIEQLLINMAQAPDVPVAGVSLLSPEEQELINQKYSQSLEVDFAEATLQARLFKSFDLYKDQPALEYKGRQFTYEELNVRSDKIAHLLGSTQLAEGSPVGILCEDRSLLICAMLATLKTRMVFVPLETMLPGARLASMIEQSAATTIITDQNASLYKAMDTGDSINWLTAETIGELDTTPFRRTAAFTPEDHIYIYFTSGSTGLPKGVIGKNRSLLHFVDWEITEFGIDDSFRISQFTNPGFDAILRDIFVPLSAGATICIPDDEVLSSGEDIARWIDTQRVSLIHCVPSFFKLFQKNDLNKVQLFQNLKYILMAGEKILPSELENWYDKYGDRVQLVNLYGTTETTLIKGLHLIHPDDVKRPFIPVRAIPGAQFIALDTHLNACPTGVAGEIYIRTSYQTAGYLNRESLNKTSFVPNPFGNDESDLIYKTGDLGRITPDGELEILGRSDQQVKVRGVRIELDEIKTNLLKYDGLNDAIVTTRKVEEDESVICAYLLTDGVLEQDELRTFLSKLLPKSMVPTYLIKVPEFPLLPNGKIDRKALADIDLESTQEHVGAGNETEQKLVEIWSEVTKMEPDTISITRSFFEMGAHSLKLLLFMNRINKEFEVKMPLMEIFNRKNITLLADYLIAISHKEFEQSDEGEIIEISI